MPQDEILARVLFNKGAGQITAGEGLQLAAAASTIAGGKQPSLLLEADTEVVLECQRCLQPFAAQVSHQTELLLARDEGELDRLDADEPEVLLAIPA